MRKIRFLLSKVSVFFLLITCSGCWNYKEIDRLSIVTGIAIDEGELSKYSVTFEFADVSSSGKETKIGSKVVQMEGETIFDAVRNTIKLSGKRLYLGHVKVVIINKDIAKKGILQVLDFLNRDQESRLNLNIMISKEDTAREILTQQAIVSPNRSMELYQMIKSQVNLSKAPDTNLKELINAISGEGISAVLPAVRITESNGYKTSEITGAAVFKGDKLIGFLSENETKIFLLITNEAKRGLLVLKHFENALPADITLEILRTNNTKIRPSYLRDKLVININTDIKVAFAEQGGNKDYSTEEGLKQLRSIAEDTLNTQILSLIKKVQQEYEVDIFGFGQIVKAKKPKLWKKYENNWVEEYKNLDIKAESRVEIKNSGVTKKPIKVGD
jgi:spore germination protein KC